MADTIETHSQEPNKGSDREVKSAPQSSGGKIETPVQKG